MDLKFTSADKSFSEEVRAFIAEHLPEQLQRAQRLTPALFAEPEISDPWNAALNRKGWGAPAWPKEVGGPGWTATQRFIFEMECARAGVPVRSGSGVKLVGPVIIKYGTPEQKSFYLPRILSGEDYWCQGYSEPGAGSDLAALQTRAVSDGDDYIVNGTKIWTTHAHYANRMFALVRTASLPKRQDGITFLLIDMDSPGITVRPIKTIGGDHEVNQVFFDDVPVPKRNRIGEENAGWTYAKYLLTFERGGGINSPRLRAALASLKDMAERRKIPLERTPLAAIGADIDSLEMLELRILDSARPGQSPGEISSVLKLRNSQLKQAVSEAAVDILGADALKIEVERPLYNLQLDPAEEDQAYWVAQYLNGRAVTIFGGSREVQLGIVAKTFAGV